MPAELFANLPTTTVSSGGTTAPPSGTSESWTVTSSSGFPAASSGASPPTQFHVADQASGKTSEIVAVTNVSGTTWTVTRGAEGTVPVAHSTGFTVYQVVTAAGLSGMLQSANNLSDVGTRQTALNNLAGAVTSGDYLRGSGSNVVMSAIQAGDVPQLADYAPTGLTGATAATRYVGATTSGAPVSGTFAVGDYVVDQSGKIWICTTAGTPGTWTQAGTSLPLTTLGDTLYENATPALARLAGNTTSTKNFLTQTGTGSVSAAPAWGTIAAGDMPAGTTSAQGALQLDGTASDIQPDGVAAAGAKGQAADAKHVHPYQPWQFLPEAYGAQGDGKTVGDVVVNGTTTITSATANFTSGDAGKHIMINGALGATAGPLITTIASVTNSTTVVLANTAGVSIGSCQMAWGTDDTAAINSAVSAAKTYALANGYFAEVVFAAKIYVLASGPTQTGNGSSTITYNSQIPVPYPGTGTTCDQRGRKLTFKFTGSAPAGNTVFWDSTTPNMPGTCLVSMTTAPSSIDATFGVQSVIGGPTAAAGFTNGSGVSLNFCDTYVAVTDIAVWCGCYTNQTAFDFSHLAQMYADRCQALILSVPGYDGGAGPLLKDIWTQGATASLQGAGLRVPLGGNNAALDCPSFSVQGYTFGAWLNDHFTCDRLTTVYTVVSVRIDLGSGAGTCSQITIQNFDCEATQTGISVPTGGIQPVYINMDCETGSGSVAYDVYDPNNSLFGQVNWTDPADSRTPVVNGAANLRVINNFIGPGHMASPPSVPSSTSTATLVYRDAWVVVHTGSGVTVSAVTVAGTATGLTMAQNSSLAVRVASGKTIALTYAGGTPTWDWWLD